MTQMNNTGNMVETFKSIGFLSDIQNMLINIRREVSADFRLKILDSSENTLTIQFYDVYTSIKVVMEQKEEDIKDSALHLSISVNNLVNGKSITTQKIYHYADKKNSNFAELWNKWYSSANAKSVSMTKSDVHAMYIDNITLSKQAPIHVFFRHYDELLHNEYQYGIEMTIDNINEVVRINDDRYKFEDLYGYCIGENKFNIKEVLTDNEIGSEMERQEIAGKNKMNCLKYLFGDLIHCRFKKELIKDIGDFKKEYDSWFKKIGCVYGIDHAMDVYGMLSDTEIGSASLVELNSFWKNSNEYGIKSMDIEDAFHTPDNFKMDFSNIRNIFKPTVKGFDNWYYNILNYIDDLDNGDIRLVMNTELKTSDRLGILIVNGEKDKLFPTELSLNFNTDSIAGEYMSAFIED